MKHPKKTQEKVLCENCKSEVNSYQALAAAIMGTEILCEKCEEIKRLEKPRFEG